MARLVFLDEAARTLYVDWERVAGDCLAMLRLYAGRHPDDPQLTEMVGELSLHSDAFRSMWADHDVSLTPRAPNASTTLSSAISPSTTWSWPSKATSSRPSPSPRPNAYPSAEALDLLASWTSPSATASNAREGTTHSAG